MAGEGKTSSTGGPLSSEAELDNCRAQISFVALVSCSPPSLCSRSPRPPAWPRCPRGPTASACRRAAAGSSSRRSAALLSRLRALRRVHLPRLASSASRTSSALAVRHSPIARACARTFEAHRAVWGEHDASRVHGDGSRTPGWGLWAGVSNGAAALDGGDALAVPRVSCPPPGFSTQQPRRGRWIASAPPLPPLTPPPPSLQSRRRTLVRRLCRAAPPAHRTSTT